MLENASEPGASPGARPPRPTPPPTRVLLVDHDHPSSAALLPAAADVVVVGQAADDEQAVRLAAELSPDVVLLTLPSTGPEQVAVVRRLVAGGSRTRVVVLAPSPGADGLTAALSAGAAGYLLSDSEPRDLLAAVRSAAQGHTPLNPRVTRALLPSPAPGDGPVETLSGREREVLSLVAAGLSNAEIAEALGISENTVKVHLTRTYRRIAVPDRASAVRWARQHLPPR